MSRLIDALVIGASPNGLVAAAYLAKAGVRVTVLEAGAVAGGACANMLNVDGLPVPEGAHALYALDPCVLKDLKLARLGLRFAARDLELVNLRSGEEPLQIGRDLHAAERRISALSQRDADRFVEFRRDLFAFARAMRAVWWEDGTLVDEAAQAERRRLGVTGASAFLDGSFESEALKSALVFDAMAGGAAPSAAGTSLLLAWRAAQEMCGLQGAVAIPSGGTVALVAVLQKAAEAAGAEIRTRASVERLSVSDDTVSGAILASGEEITARIVLSSLSRRRSLLEFAPDGVAGFAGVPLLRRPQEVGEAKLVLALSEVPGFAAHLPPSRFVVADRVESCVAAHAEARAGRLPVELALEAVVPTFVDPSSVAPRKHILSVLVRPLPIAPAEGWPELEPQLVDIVVAALERHAPGLKKTITGQHLVVPTAPGCDPLNAVHLLADWRTRIETPIDGLLLCGETAEPVPAVSGRAGRIAAAMAVSRLKKGTAR